MMPFGIIMRTLYRLAWFGMRTALPVFLGVVALASAATYTNPVLPGDFPDPSVIRVGEVYWATATTSEWAPLFPLLRSRDLVNWELVGHVFETRPDWSVANYWAPEISEYRGRFYLFYSGNGCCGRACNYALGVARARALL